MPLPSLSPDLLDRILTFLPDFRTLSAFIRTSKNLYSVFQARPKSIVKAITQNASGDPNIIPAAVRLAYVLPGRGYKRKEDNGDDALPKEREVAELPLTRAICEALVYHAPVVKELEDIFSWIKKDRTSRTSKLTVDESSRFRRAMYRFWLYCELYREPPDEDWYTFPRRVFFQALPLEELLELGRAADFCAELLLRTDNSCGCASSLVPTVTYFRDISAMGPARVLWIFQSLEPQEPEDVEEGFFWYPFFLNLIHHQMSPKIGHEALLEAILSEVTGSQDECDRCHAACGINLWGPSNWDLLRGIFCPTFLGTFYPNNLQMNNTEVNLLLDYLSDVKSRFRNYITFDYAQFMEEIVELHDEEAWSRDGWYCLECVSDLLRERFVWWWLEKKQKAGIRIPLKACAWGYDCCLQGSDWYHARTMNHLCRPTRRLMSPIHLNE
ncbi:uncharacterized protein LAESUDRAFT_679904 [Laetiporus sulphureus 93-53]|uniref:F-box domain-containing protein n=1 Tax=Laetiporus sulphureus 93-53 TaxID=1314785 RepID=A0A165E6I1_9APHY|nr:uncharacterized protein LAESUDRAFT_679904 [Laetiporus sulphureus 93-53]KZT06332.1 hypothetical protein LAESUDRAFT_679904 [Laetiporus sulphureus 93-53]